MGDGTPSRACPGRRAEVVDDGSGSSTPSGTPTPLGADRRPDPLRQLRVHSVLGMMHRASDPGTGSGDDETQGRAPRHMRALRLGRTSVTALRPRAETRGHGRRDRLPRSGSSRVTVPDPGRSTLWRITAPQSGGDLRTRRGPVPAGTSRSEPLLPRAGRGQVQVVLSHPDGISAPTRSRGRQRAADMSGRSCAETMNDQGGCE